MTVSVPELWITDYQAVPDEDISQTCQSICAQARAQGRAVVTVIGGLSLIAYPSTQPEEVRQSFEAFSHIRRALEQHPQH